MYSRLTLVVLLGLGFVRAALGENPVTHASEIDTALAERHHVRPCEWWTSLGADTVPTLTARFNGEARTWRRVRIAEVARCFDPATTTTLRGLIAKDPSPIVRAAINKPMGSPNAGAVKARGGTAHVAPRPR